MTTTLSSATAAAKAAQAELTAPVAANNAGAGVKSTPAGGKPAASNGSESNAGQAAAKPAQSNQNNQAGSAGQAGNSRQASAANQADSRSQTDSTTASAAQLAAQAATDAAPVAAPLFSQLLNLADVAGDSDAGSDTSVKSDSDDSTGSGSAAAGNVLPAMITSLLNAAAPAPAAPVNATASDSATVDAISATATLNSSATRLNLAAASVAVTPAAPLADDAAATAAVAAQAAAPAAVPQSVFAQTNNATLAAVAVRQSEAGAPTATPSDSPAPAVDADAAAQPFSNTAPLKEAWVNGARIVTRSADTTAANTASTAAPATAAATVAASGDERSFSLAGSGINNTHANGAAPAAAPATAATSSTVTLAGTPEQWQQPLREALGDRLQLQLQRNNDQAVIRLEPPNMGSIEISIRHSAGALQVNLSANNSEVLRQLNTIGDSVRQDLSNRQFTDVAVTVSSSRAQAQADQGGQGGKGQQRGQDDSRAPGRALSEDDSTATFAMTGE